MDTNLSISLGAGVGEVLEICSAENVRKTFKVGFLLYLKDGTKWFKFEIFDWSHSTSSREEKYGFVCNESCDKTRVSSLYQASQMTVSVALR